MPLSAELVEQLEAAIEALPWWRRLSLRGMLALNGWPDISPRAGGCGAAVAGVLAGMIIAIIVATCATR